MIDLHKLQCNLDHLDDTDRSSRIYALNALTQALIQTPSAPLEIRLRFIADNLIEPLVDIVVSDPVEKCRDLSLSIIAAFACDFGANDLVVLARCFIPAACPKFGSGPFKESVEELRLRLIETSSAILLRISYESKSKYGDLLAHTFLPSLIPALADTFYKAKQAAVTAVCNVCRVSPCSVHVHLEDLTNKLISNLRHKHAKTRLVVLNAIVNVARVSSVSDMFPNVTCKVILPALQNVCMDTSATVRSGLARSLGAWLAYGYFNEGNSSSLPTRNTAVRNVKELLAFDAGFLALLVGVIADETQEVATQAVSELNAVGLQWQLLILQAVPKQSNTNTLNALPLSPVNFDIKLKCLQSPSGDIPYKMACPVSFTASRLITSHFPQILDIELTRAAHWIPATRARGAQALAALMALSSMAVISSPSQIRKLVLTCSQLLCDDDKSVRDGACVAARTLGATLVDHTAIFDALMPLALGEITFQGVQTASSRKSAIDVVAAVLSGIDSACATQHDTTIATILSLHAEKSVDDRANNTSTDIIDAADISLCSALESLSSLEPEFCQDAIVIMVRVLLLSPTFSTVLLANPISSHENSPAIRCVFLLMKLTDSSSACVLVERHLSVLIRSLPTVPPCYDGNSGAWFLLDMLVRICPEILTSAFDTTVTPILLIHAHPLSNPQPEARICALSLIHALIVAPNVHDKLSDFAATALLDRAVVPNLVWSAGRTAATTRKTALAVLHALLRACELAPPGRLGACFEQSTSKLFPALKTSIEDYDTSSREISLSCLTTLFNILPAACLQHAEVGELYPALVKRLDDSIDSIRLEACATFIAFIRVAVPESLKGTALEYCAEHLLIHLDDPCSEIQNAVFNVLSALAHLDADAVIKKTSAICASHRDPALCDQLIKKVSLRGRSCRF